MSGSPRPGSEAALLRTLGLRVTPQRLAVVGALEQRSHPTAEEIYRAVSAEFPGLRLATVYNILAALETHGFLHVVDDKKGRRYDTGLEPHQHIRCRRCGRLDNLPQWDAEAWLTASAPPDWVVEGWAVVADGVCPTCQAMPDQPPARADP